MRHTAGRVPSRWGSRPLEGRSREQRSGSPHDQVVEERNAPNPGRSAWMHARWADPEFAARQRANLARGRRLRWSIPVPNSRAITEAPLPAFGQLTQAASHRPDQAVDRSPSSRPRAVAQAVGTVNASVTDKSTTRRSGTVPSAQVAGAAAFAGLGLAIIAAFLRHSAARNGLRPVEETSATGPAVTRPLASWRPPEYRW